MAIQTKVNLALRPINTLAPQAMQAIATLLATCTLKGSDVPTYNGILSILEATYSFDQNNDVTVEDIQAFTAAPPAPRKRRSRAEVAAEKAAAAEPIEVPDTEASADEAAEDGGTKGNGEPDAPAKRTRQRRALPAKSSK